MKRITVVLGVVAVVGVVSAAGYLGFRNAQSPARDTQPRPPATVQVSRGDVERTVSAPGQLVDTRETVLGMQVGGRLAQVNVRAGDRVKAGQRLAVLDPSELQATEQ